MATPAKILVLDDEVGITRITSAMLKMQRHTVTALNNPLEALELVKNDSGFELAVVDYMMPEMSGKDFITEVKKQYPSLKCIMLSAKKTGRRR